MVRIEFYAWIGHYKNLNTEEPQEFFTKKFNTLKEAKNIINAEKCFIWEEGEWEGCYITISFKRNPKIYDSKSQLVSECKIIDWKTYQAKWFDLDDSSLY